MALSSSHQNSNEERKQSDLPKPCIESRQKHASISSNPAKNKSIILNEGGVYLNALKKYLLQQHRYQEYTAVDTVYQQIQQIEQAYGFVKIDNGKYDVEKAGGKYQPAPSQSLLSSLQPKTCAETSNVKVRPPTPNHVHTAVHHLHPSQIKPKFEYRDVDYVKIRQNGAPYICPYDGETFILYDHWKNHWNHIHRGDHEREYNRRKKESKKRKAYQLKMKQQLSQQSRLFEKKGKIDPICTPIGGTERIDLTGDESDDICTDTDIDVKEMENEEDVWFEEIKDQESKKDAAQIW
eukprot:CAMPEP_0201578704 /NCGR_PEP_ID=MMETSP0190_2-20130828/25725_1 /ASSEMBLY_ACC=CAM_ASM_000263 /TAXON_ID=37353 /ORGANISM="Rosalina sp." /LENGTH=293 /DNA_ID=CAMNT_0048012191 /DNA_START=367 /DNA_END=1245 /DNA_ORIENTATION=-